MSVESVITENLDIWTSAIKTKSASGRGSSNKLELYGIKKLRELILQLAVRGKLVPQNSNEEPAEKLIEKIEVAKQKLIKDRVFKKVKARQPTSEQSYPHKLPSSWKFISLTEAYYPISPSGKKLKKTEILEEGLYPVVDQGQEFISGYTNNESVLIKIPNDVIVFGDHTRNLKLINFDFVAGADGTKILCPILIEPNFFYLSLCSFDLESRGYGRHFKILNESFLALPPLAEQSRIVTKVNELMTLCDQLESQTESSIGAHKTLVETLLATLTNAKDVDELNESWQRISEHFDTLFTTEDSIDQLKQTILQLAVMGKLVKQDPNDEPASVLLERISEEKEQLIKDKIIKKQKELAPISEAEKPFELPASWVWTRLGEISTIKGGKRLPKGHELTTKETPYVYIRVSDMKDGSISDRDLQYISSETNSLISSYIIESNDIYMTIVGATIGKCGLVPEKFNGMNLTENAARIILHGGISKEFLYLLLDSQFSQLQFLDKTKQVGVQKMALNRLSSTLLPIPSISEQLRIAEKIYRLFNICDNLKSGIQLASNTQNNLADSISYSLVN